MLHDTRNSQSVMNMASTLKADPDPNGHVLAMPMSLYKEHYLMKTSTWKRTSQQGTNGLSWELNDQTRPEYFQLHTNRAEFTKPKITQKCFKFAWLTSKNKLKDAEPMNSATSFFFRLAQQRLRRQPNPIRTQRIWTHSQTVNDQSQSMMKKMKYVKRSSLKDEPSFNPHFSTASDHIRFSQPQKGARRPPPIAAFESISNTLLRCHTIDECPERWIQERKQSGLSNGHMGRFGNIKVIGNQLRTTD